VGEPVAVNPDLPCGRCELCRVGEYALCENFVRLGTRTDGGFAEFVRVPRQNLLPLPRKTDYEMGAMLEPAATALHTVIRGEVFPGDVAVVMGCGCIGCLIGQELQVLGARRVLVVDIVAQKLEIAERVGLAHRIDARSQDPLAAVMEATHRRGADVVFESAGATVVLNQAIHLTRKLGRVALLGLINQDVVLSQESYSRVIRGELHLRGVFGNEYKPFPANAWEVALDYVSQGRVQVKPLVTHRFPIEEIDRAFALMRDQRTQVNKILFEFS
jgi:L-iditol 2-dehydrogenase